MVGDGSLQMNIQELAFLEELNLNVKIIVFDNNKLGIVSQFQNMNWKSDPTCGQKRNPNFVEISLAYGIPADEISEVALLESKLTWLRDLSGPGLLSIKTADDIDVTPLLLAKDAIDNMWPYQKVT
jgi:acetolactate synthase-1/2/3 large subunit